MPRESNRGRGVVRNGESMRAEPAPVGHLGPLARAAPLGVGGWGVPADPSSGLRALPHPAAPGATMNGCAPLADVGPAAHTRPRPSAETDDRPPPPQGPAGDCQAGARASRLASPWRTGRDGRHLRADAAPLTAAELRALLPGLRRPGCAGARVARVSLARLGLLPGGWPARPTPPLPNAKACRTRAVLRWTLRAIGRPVGLRALAAAARAMLR